MKKITFAFLFSFLLVFSCVFASCNAKQSIFGSSEEDDTSKPSTTYDTAIRELENKLVELQQLQYVASVESRKELERLQALLDTSIQNDDTTPSDPTDADPSIPEETDKEEEPAKPEARFLYILNGDKLTITGYTGDETHLVIPSEIDGYRVCAISDNAFESSKLQSVILTNGIEKIGWFAFAECPDLESVTIPASVSSIGYSAFDADANEQFTIYCSGDSFALRYAQSYGLTYAII